MPLQSLEVHSVHFKFYCSKDRINDVMETLTSDFPQATHKLELQIMLWNEIGDALAFYFCLSNSTLWK